uniref:LLM class flavin-dependent oxidoreductase n=1 Tax=Mesomycoplasma ovipneumoniae TaxID=29562 RepID=UPI003080125F
GLWDTYEDDAFIRDKASGVFLDTNKMHALNYRGNYFSVDGPLTINRSVQGSPVLSTAGTSTNMMEHAAKYTDGTLIHNNSLAESVGMATGLKRRVAF